MRDDTKGPLCEMILDEIVAHKRQEVSALSCKRPLNVVREQARQRQPASASFMCGVSGPGLSIIAEIKRASPSKGMIATQFDPAQLARAYRDGGAHALSCLTDERFFMGHADHLVAAKEATGLPILRKDFVLGEYQIWETAALGASAVLLIVAIIDQAELERLIQIAGQAELDALVETHDADEAKRALDAGATILGINNRDLRDFTVDLRTTERVLSSIDRRPPVVVSESGIREAADIEWLRDLGVQAALVGETLMRAESICDKTREFVRAGLIRMSPVA